MTYLRLLSLWGLCLFFQLPQSSAQNFISSNLPIVVIDTQGEIIVDEPKITATMGIIDNGPGQRDLVTDDFNGYDGLIGIEIRGSSSQALYDKKSFAVETRKEDGSNRNVEILGMPEENDWVLYGPGLARQRD